MSVLAQLVSDSVTTHATLAAGSSGSAARGVAVQLADGGFFDTATSLNTKTQTLLRAATVTAAIAFVIFAAIKSRGAAAAVIVSGLVAAVFCYIVFNVTELQGKATTDLNGLGPTITAPPTPEPVTDNQLEVGQVTDQ